MQHHFSPKYVVWHKMMSNSPEIIYIDIHINIPNILQFHEVHFV